MYNMPISYIIICICRSLSNSDNVRAPDSDTDMEENFDLDQDQQHWLYLVCHFDPATSYNGKDSGPEYKVIQMWREK